MTNRIDKIQHSRDTLLSQPLQKKEPTLKLKTLRWCGSTNKDYVQGFWNLFTTDKYLIHDATIKVGNDKSI